MTRKKKSRSLKRIHNVKTGSVSKLKRAANTDRQSSLSKKKDKPKSIYQKFIDDNPDAAEKQIANNGVQSASKEQRSADASNTNKEQKPQPAVEKEKDLLSQLDSKTFNDVY